MASDGSYLITVTNFFLSITMKFLRQRERGRKSKDIKRLATVIINCIAMATPSKDLRECSAQTELDSV